MPADLESRVREAVRGAFDHLDLQVLPPRTRAWVEHAISRSLWRVDIDCPGDRGHLLAVVRAAYRDPRIGVISDATLAERGSPGSRWVDHWRVVSSSRSVIMTLADAATETEALVVALEQRDGASE